MQVYFLEKVWLCDGLNFSVDDIRNEVARGLWLKEMASFAIGRKYELTDELLHDLMQFEELDQNRRERIAERRGVNNTTERGAGVDRKFRQPLEAVKSEEAESRSGVVSYTREIKCYKCKNVGHIARDCTKERAEIICYLCK